MQHRPALDAMLDAARARRIGRILCTSLDRLARSPQNLAALTAELSRLGVEIVVLDQRRANSARSCCANAEPRCSRTCPGELCLTYTRASFSRCAGVISGGHSGHH